MVTAVLLRTKVCPQTATFPLLRVFMTKVAYVKATRFLLHLAKPTLQVLHHQVQVSVCFTMPFRIMEWFGLEGILKRLTHPTSSPWARACSLKSGCSEPHPISLGMFKGMRHSLLSRQPARVFYHPNIQSKPIFFSKNHYTLSCHNKPG